MMVTLILEETKPFRQAMIKAGITPPSVINTEGEIQRFYVKGDKPGSNNGWCVFHSGAPAFGAFGCWKRGIKEKWTEMSIKQMTSAQKAEYLAKKEQIDLQVEQEYEKKHDECRIWSKSAWQNAPSATDSHPYLQLKKVPAYGLKIYKDSLMVPLMDFSSVIHGVQFILPGGTKFLKSGTKKAGNYFRIGDWSSEILVICEGYATGASIYEATGYDVVVAFDAGNLMSVAHACRSKYQSKKIIIAADNDQWKDVNIGLQKATEAAKATKAILAVPSSDKTPLGEKPTDFNDYARLFSLDFVKAILDKAISDAAPGNRIKVVTLHELLAMKLPPRVNLLEPWFPLQGLAMIYAYRGVGKTQAGLEIAYALASGGAFLGWHALEPVNVLYLDGEMPASVLQERVFQIAASSDHKLKASFDFVTPDIQDSSKGMIDLSRPEDQAELEHKLEGVKVIILDNLSTLCRTGKENEGEAWLPVQEWCLRQRKAGRSVLIIHHAGKNGEQRGSSRREDVLDTVISLKRPGDYTPDQGATFEVHFEKARGLTGNEVLPFLAMLTSDANGKRLWIKKDLEKSTAEKVAALLNEGYSQHEIVDLLNLAKGTVSKANKKAISMGLLKVKAK